MNQGGVQPAPALTCGGCVDCQPLPPDVRCALRAKDRLNEGHLSTRFGDHASAYRIFFKEVDVTDVAFETMVGDPGWVLVYHSHATPFNPHFCPLCKGQPCAVLLRGKVATTSILTALGLDLGPVLSDFGLDVGIRGRKGAEG